ncbi:MAG: hypothetical protein KDA71_01480 [Planctomycetales bacterium]|nr:hypothetical protein [Planctomycetales bacterium]
MARIPDYRRLVVVDNHLGHWAQANQITGEPFEIVPGFGVEQLRDLRNQLRDLQDSIGVMEMQLIVARADRNAMFGSTNEQGVWGRLKHYKPLLKARLGSRNPLARTVPAIGRVAPKHFNRILQAFIDHWAEVNAQVTPAFTLGPYTLAMLQAEQAALAEKMTAISQLETALLPLAREQREQLFGDEAEEVREENSIVSRLLLYRAIVRAMFATQPIADSLPDLFPAQSNGAGRLPTVRFNYQPLANGIETWHEVPAEAGDAQMAYVREGGLEEVRTLNQTTPGSVEVIEWPNVSLVDELDEFELRSMNNLTVARGTHDPSLPRPLVAVT